MLQQGGALEPRAKSRKLFASIPPARSGSARWELLTTGAQVRYGRAAARVRRATPLAAECGRGHSARLLSVPFLTSITAQ